MTTTSTSDPLTDRASTIQGLRDLADFLDTHPDVPVNSQSQTFYIFPETDCDACGRAFIDRVAAAISKTPTTSANSYYSAYRSFGPIEYAAVHIPSGTCPGHSAPAPCTSTGPTAPEPLPEVTR